MVTLLQYDIQWLQPLANMQAAEAAIMAAPKSDLYILPEMWSTGFVTEPRESIGKVGMDSLLWMQNMADKMDAAIAGSLPFEEDGRYYNRLYFITPQKNNTPPQEGKGLCYSKRHLFTYGGEDRHYTPGQERVIVEWRGIRYLLQICYDLRFPVFSRNSYDALHGAKYDCILYVASWPTSRRQVWDVLLRARAIENQCYVCGVNRIGSDPQCQYNGGTQIIDPYGKTVEACMDNQASTISATLDMERLQAFRQKFPVLRDADSF